MLQLLIGGCHLNLLVERKINNVSAAFRRIFPKPVTFEVLFGVAVNSKFSLGVCFIQPPTNMGWSETLKVNDTEL